MVPFGKFLGIVNGPGIGDVMDGANKVIPGMHRGEFADPGLMAGEVIHLESEADGQLGKFLLGNPDFGDVLIELREVHPPNVEIVLAHGGVVGETDLRKAKVNGVAGIFFRLVDGVVAERSMHVIIERHGAVSSFGFEVSSVKKI